MTIKKCTFSFLILCRILVCIDARGKMARLGPTKTFNVLDYGAIPGPRYDSSEPFIRAWRAACDFNGSHASVVLVPRGVFMLSETMFEGPCQNSRPITFILKGTLRAVADITDFPDQGWISFYQIDGLIFTGGGTIDGQGQNLWKLNDCKKNNRCVHLPASLYISHVQNARIWSLKLFNAMGFHMHVTSCHRIRLSGLRMTAPAHSPNTDGMHISKSSYIKVVRTVVATGDDCISIGHGTSNIAIKKVTCGPGHGISLGSLGKVPDEKDVNGIIVSNCTLKNTTNGVRIKTYPASAPSTASNVVFKDIILEHVKNPIIIDQHYGNHKNKTDPSRVQIQDVIFRNIQGTSITPESVNLNCSRVVPCNNIHLDNINIHYKGIEDEKPSSVCTHAVVTHAGAQFPPPCFASRFSSRF